MVEKDLRELFKIPAHYNYDGFLEEKQVYCFSLCDSSIHILMDGTATETHMGLSYGSDQHEFITSPWETD